MRFDEAVFFHDVGCHKAECGMESSAIEILHTRDWHTLDSAMRYNLASTYDSIVCTPDDSVSDRRIPRLGVTAGVAGCNFDGVCEPNRVAHVARAERVMPLMGEANRECRHKKQFSMTESGDTQPRHWMEVDHIITSYGRCALLRKLILIQL